MVLGSGLWGGSRLSYNHTSSQALSAYTQCIIGHDSSILIVKALSAYTQGLDRGLGLGLLGLG